MSIHIWCPRFSESAIALRNSLRAKGLQAYKTVKDIEGRSLRKFISRVKQGDLWVNWGKPYYPALPNIVSLNAIPYLNKKQQLLKLSISGVETLEVSNHQQDGWLGRALNHQEGIDLLNNSGHDYWTRKLDFSREMRIHIYKGHSIHAGIKVPRIENPHPWIRSYTSGWKIDYSRAKDISSDRRELAKQAIDVLGLDFGAVDIGIIRNGGPVVIEVNTAPGLDIGPSVEVYTNMFLKEITQCN